MARVSSVPVQFISFNTTREKTQRETHQPLRFVCTLLSKSISRKGIQPNISHMGKPNFQDERGQNASLIRNHSIIPETPDCGCARAGGSCIQGYRSPSSSNPGLFALQRLKGREVFPALERPKLGLATYKACSLSLTDSSSQEHSNIGGCPQAYF